MVETAVIIVNWNGKKLLEGCLKSLRHQSYRNFKVYLVDNNSKDDSVIYVEKKFKEVCVIKLKKNYGFAKGNNQGIKKAVKDKETRYIVTLNNDTIVDKKWLENLVGEAKRNPTVGAVASKTIYLSNKKMINTNGISIYQDGHAVSWRGFKNVKDYTETEEIFAPSAVAALYKKDVLKKTGLFDSRFFMYEEEVDLGWRIRFAGYKSVYSPNAIVYHAHSATSKAFSELKAYYSERNRIWVVFKNFTCKMMFRSLGYTFKRYRAAIKALKLKKGPVSEFTKKEPKYKLFTITLKAWIIATLTLPFFINKRIKIQKIRKQNNIDDKTIEDWFKKFGTTAEKIVRLE